MASFAERQLLKYGWKSGQGLGKNSDGRNKAISVSIKNDTDGLGAKKDEWNFAWWDHIFNKTTSAIQVEADDSGSIQITKSSKTEQKSQQRDLLYGSFVKSGGKSAVEESKEDYSVRVTDEELLQACEGRTARKGARAHQPGKLRRTKSHAILVAGATLKPENIDSDDDTDQVRHGEQGSKSTAPSLAQDDSDSGMDEDGRTGLGAGGSNGQSNDQRDIDDGTSSKKISKKSKCIKSTKSDASSKPEASADRLDAIARKMRKVLASKVVKKTQITDRVSNKGSTIGSDTGASKRKVKSKERKDRTDAAAKN